ncbi:MAG TPA: SDR family NAD(P)-dependent oxidoreductase [Solirubrobacteraceae bacterium]|nr:SDR family NAD(P)-dependent oxidoreductase [Solirubrobacteraceae bacterium]
MPDLRIPLPGFPAGPLVVSTGEVARSVGRVARATAAPLLPTRSLEAAVGGRTVLVTGSSYGIGRATAAQVAQAGATTILVARDEDRLAELASEIAAGGGAAHAYPADLADMEAIARLADRLAADGHEVDVLVNNAARSIRRSLAETYDRLHDFERTMRLNYFGAVHLTMALLPGMRERGRGHVVNVSTMGTQTSTPRFAAYLASKAALEAFTRVAAAECLGDGVRFSVVHMPLVRTPMIEPTAAYEGLPALSPEQAGGLIGEALRSQAEYVGPRVGTASEVLSALFPAGANEVLHALYRGMQEPE